MTHFFSRTILQASIPLFSLEGKVLYMCSFFNFFKLQCSSDFLARESRILFHFRCLALPTTTRNVPLLYCFTDYNQGGDKLMASISHIQSFEAANLSSIYLHQDGIFWRAYERSAYLFVEHTKSQYKLTKRYIKLVLSDLQRDLIALRNAFSD